MAGADYPYKRLNLPTETRVLIVSPGQFDDPLIGSLSHTSIASPDEPYEALSYCWNSSVNTEHKVDPDTLIPFSLYGHDDDGNLVDEGGSIAFKDMVDDPRIHLRAFYIRLGGKVPDGLMLLDDEPVTIGGELYRALRHLRDEKSPLRIWVDALCINQQDLSERNEHVKIMGQIYANASQVRIWLGDEIGIEMEVIDMLHGLHEFFHDLFVVKGMAPNGSTIKEVLLPFVKSPEMQRLQWEKIAEFVDRAWFHRTWVIQEIANARKAIVHIGRWVLHWEALAQVISTLRKYHLDAPINMHRGLKAIIMMDWLRQERLVQQLPHSTMDLLTLAEELRDFQSTLPSDKIYGILGLTSSKDDLTVDYSLTPEQMFTSFAIWHLKTSPKPLDILTHCVDVPSKPRVLDLPSWVPDWTRAGHVEPFRVRGLRCNACGNGRYAKPSFQIDARGDPRSLHIRGRILDRIAAVETVLAIPAPKESPGLPFMAPFGVPAVPGGEGEDQNELEDEGDDEDEGGNGEDDNDWEDVDEDEEVDVQEPHLPGLKPKPIFDPAQRNSLRMKARVDNMIASFCNMLHIADPALAQVLAADPSPPDSNEEMWPTYEALWRSYMCNRKRDNGVPGPECADGFGVLVEMRLTDKTEEEILGERMHHMMAMHGLPKEVADEFRDKLRTAYDTVLWANSKWCNNRRFFKSEGGRFGWAVDGVREGDVVVGFDGGEYLFVLREVDGQQGRWRIIGDCWLGGFEDGQGFAEEGVSNSLGDGERATMFNII